MGLTQLPKDDVRCSFMFLSFIGVTPFLHYSHNNDRDGSSWMQMDNRAKKGKWVVTEKVHGSNFCISSNGTDVRCAKRSEWLTPDGDSDYYDCAAVVSKYSPLIKVLHAKLKGQQEEAIVWVYGELFGGFFPGGGGSEESAIQKEILYCGHVDWIVFDIAFSSTGSLKDAAFLQFSFMVEMCSAVGLPHTSPLYTGSMNTCMHYKNHFASTISARFGLPVLPANVAEGVVIRCDVALNKGAPFFEVVLVDAKAKAVRPIAKSKCDAFAEVVKAADGATPKAQLEAYATTARWANVISKLGKRYNVDRARQLFAEDILEEAAIQDGALASYIEKNRSVLLKELILLAPK